ncbi:MAG: SpoIIE family protein phosphatase, partial [Verrucomicrobiaceae bacterium]|nr:SpoIIE family protein phosphatase [Verrucomicrobiaceae bacterium]
GRVFTLQKSELIPDLGGGTSATVLLGPLSFGNRRLGVLALSAPKDERQFNANDFEVFNSITEQSAVALANAMSHQEAARNRADQQEIDNAGEIQKVLLPDRDPKVPGYRIAGKNIPARRLSGDYFDFIDLPGGRFGAVIADVSGKGMPGALVTVMCRTLLRAAAQGTTSPTTALSSLNRAIGPDMREDMFITMTYLVLEHGSPVVTLARAGHTDALVWRKNTGRVEAMRSPGMGVGIDDSGVVFERVTKDLSFDMQPGDCLLLFTDGVNEAMNPQGDEFGEARIETALARLAPAGPQAVLDGLLAELDTFLAGKRSHDDITLIALQKTA